MEVYFLIIVVLGTADSSEIECSVKSGKFSSSAG